jgi:hypothetical protein
MPTPVVCPHCGVPIGNLRTLEGVERLGVRMSPFKAHILDTIKRCGQDGIESAMLYEMLFGHRDPMPSRNNLRLHVAQINELLEDEGWRIAGSKSLHRYVLVRHSSLPEPVQRPPSVATMPKRSGRRTRVVTPLGATSTAKNAGL